jgi:hypothetical protein
MSRADNTANGTSPDGYGLTYPGLEKVNLVYTITYCEIEHDGSGTELLLVLTCDDRGLVFTLFRS